MSQKISACGLAQFASKQSKISQVQKDSSDLVCQQIFQSFVQPEPFKMCRFVI